MKAVEVSENLFPDYERSDFLMLKSKARINGRHQCLHTDFTRKKNENFDFSKFGPKPYSFILSLMDNTSIIVLGEDKKPKEIKIPKFHIIMIDGDCVHAGSSHKSENFRLFWYAYPKLKFDGFTVQQSFVK